GTAGFGPAISLPLFDGGRLRGNLRLQSARYDEAVERYNGAVIGALREVADEISRQRSIQQQLVLNNTALDSARLAEQQAEQGFHAGLTDYLNVLNTQSVLLQQQRNRTQLIARQLESHAALMAALGGGYQATQEVAAHGEPQ
ncbi:TolC family protein, partial [Nevskia ramosa]